MNKEKNEKPIIMYPINANPPHIGHIATINLLMTMSSKLIVLLYDKTQVCTAKQAKFVLESIFSHYVDGDKIEIMISPANFATVSKLPESSVTGDIPLTIATTSKRIYINLKSKGYPYLTLINKPFGWRDEFYTVAYIRSILLEQIQSAKFTKHTEDVVDRL